MNFFIFLRPAESAENKATNEESKREQKLLRRSKNSLAEPVQLNNDRKKQESETETEAEVERSDSENNMIDSLEQQRQVERRQRRRKEQRLAENIAMRNLSEAVAAERRLVLDWQSERDIVIRKVAERSMRWSSIAIAAVD